MSKDYPNIQLLEYIFTNFLLRAGAQQPYDMEVYVFPQVWPTTAGGFAEPGTVAGQAFTRQYTTVLFCGDFAMVSFGDRPAYMVSKPTKAFMEDFKAMNMKSKAESEKAYTEEQKEQVEKNGEESTN